jgi:hypothetical protein
MVMFFASGIALFGLGLINLILTILSFDELFINSPFNQTSISAIEANLTPLVQNSVLMFILGMILTIFCGILIFFAIFGEFNKKDENQKVKK